MSSAQRQAIYDRLASAPTFHPLSADLFTDWNLQAGDVVTVQSGDESYASPIYSMRMKWSGAPKVEVESTGNTEREPLPAMDRKQYDMGAGMGGMQKEQERVDGILYDAGLYYNQYGVFMYATAEGNGTKLGASFKVMADRIDSVVEKTGVDSLGNNETLYSKITQTATDITMLVSRTGINNLGQSETLFSRIQQTASSIELLVRRTGINNLGEGETLYSRIFQTADSLSMSVGRIDRALNEMNGRIDIESNRIGLVVTGDMMARRSA